MQKGSFNDFNRAGVEVVKRPGHLKFPLPDKLFQNGTAGMEALDRHPHIFFRDQIDPPFFRFADFIDRRSQGLKQASDVTGGLAARTSGSLLQALAPNWIA